MILVRESVRSLPRLGGKEIGGLRCDLYKICLREDVGSVNDCGRKSLASGCKQIDGVLEGMRKTFLFARSER